MEEINAAGGVNVAGVMRNVKVDFIDSREFLSIPDAVTAVEKAITVDKYDFIMGGFRTEAVFAMSDVACDYGKIFLGIGAASQPLNDRVIANYDRYKYWFMAGYPDSRSMDYAGLRFVEMVAEAMKTELGQTPKIAVFGEKATWVEPQVTAALEYFPEKGYEVVGVWRPSSMATDVTAELTAMRAAGANIMHVIFSGPAGIAAGRQKVELGYSVASAGYNIEGLRAGYWDLLEGAADYEGPYYNGKGPCEITPKTLPAWNAYQERWDGEYFHTVATGYIGLYLLCDAIDRADSIDQVKVIEALEDTDYIAPEGRIVFRDDHNILHRAGYWSWVGLQWQNGEQVAVWPPVDGSWYDITYPGTVKYKFPPGLK